MTSFGFLVVWGAPRQIGYYLYVNLCMLLSTYVCHLALHISFSAVSASEILNTLRFRHLDSLT